MEDRTEQLRRLKQEYHDYIDRTYPNWREKMLYLHRAKVEEQKRRETEEAMMAQVNAARAALPELSKPDAVVSQVPLHVPQSNIHVTPQDKAAMARDNQSNPVTPGYINLPEAQQGLYRISSTMPSSVSPGGPSLASDQLMAGLLGLPTEPTVETEQVNMNMLKPNSPRKEATEEPKAEPPVVKYKKDIHGRVKKSGVKDDPNRALSPGEMMMPRRDGLLGGSTLQTVSSLPTGLTMSSTDEVTTTEQKPPTGWEVKVEDKPYKSSKMPSTTAGASGVTLSSPRQQGSPVVIPQAHTMEDTGDMHEDNTSQDSTVDEESIKPLKSPTGTSPNLMPENILEEQPKLSARTPRDRPTIPPLDLGSDTEGMETISSPQPGTVGQTKEMMSAAYKQFFSASSITHQSYVDSDDSSDIDERVGSLVSPRRSKGKKKEEVGKTDSKVGYTSPVRKSVDDVRSSFQTDAGSTDLLSTGAEGPSGLVDTGRSLASSTSLSMTADGKKKNVLASLVNNSDTDEDINLPARKPEDEALVDDFDFYGY